ncbi:hypothetical protein [Corallococcus silvisoli]|uniref:hypothetical protein n=1 Tax=Corallococcus silvisoli TaxID=2697031 RepID=UPI001F1E2D07|nr:hypothetical protein [Corallococcus silvisoli]
MLLRPLPYPEPEELVHLYQSTPQRERGGVSVSYLRAWREHSSAFQGIEGVTALDFTLTGGGPAQRVRAGLTTPGLLPPGDGRRGGGGGPRAACPA